MIFLTLWAAASATAKTSSPPHRAHLYQRLVIAGYSNRAVTLLYIALAAVDLLLAALWRVGGLVSDGAASRIAVALPRAVARRGRLRAGCGEGVTRGRGDTGMG